MPTTTTPIPILMYHNLGTPPAGTCLRSLYVRVGAFRRQMRLLKLLGYRGVSMSEAMPYLRGEQTGRIAVITFDDGYVDTLSEALPILLRFGFTATCYFVSGRLGQHNTWDEAALKIQKPLMDRAGVLQWSAAGMEVGAHSVNHPVLPECSSAELTHELTQCRRDLEALTHKPVTQFCYPYGRYDERVSKAVQDAGYAAATTTARGRARAGDDLFQLRRVLVGGHNWLGQILIKLTTSYEDRPR